MRRKISQVWLISMSLVIYGIGSHAAGEEPYLPELFSSMQKAIRAGDLKTVRDEYLPELEKVTEGNLGLKAQFFSQKGRCGIVLLNSALMTRHPNAKCLVLLLLAAGADVNIPGQDGFTALHRAAQWTDAEVVRILINVYEADVNAQNDWGYTPLDWVSTNPYPYWQALGESRDEAQKIADEIQCEIECALIELGGSRNKTDAARS